MILKQKLARSGHIRKADLNRVKVPMTQKGRGALSNHTGRFEPDRREDIDDGWAEPDRPVAPLRTEIRRETPRTIINYNRSPDIPFDRTINPYRGCEHGCVYCFARPTHAYQGLSAGLDFESRLFYKPNGPELLIRELSRPSYVPRPIALGMNTDAYQPLEKKLGLTRRFLEILAAHQHPVTLLTKSALILRDLDLIVPMAQRGLCRVGVSITSLDSKLSRLMEPRAATPRLRLETVRKLSEAGLQVTVMTAPIIPALNESEIEALLQAAADHGAVRAGYVLLRLPHELKDIMHEWLAEHFPDRATRIINLLREMRGGRDYDSDWFSRGSGTGLYARFIARRYALALRRYGLNQTEAMSLRTDLFRPPGHASDQYQLAF